MDKTLENKLKKEVKKYLEFGRKGWDYPHTLACVYWMKQLLKTEKGNSKILVSSIYLHDIGYSGLFEKSNSDNPDEVTNMKKEHMKRSFKISKKILGEIKGYSKKEIEKICYLVKIHDEVDKIKTKEAQLVFEADSLGQIDTKRAPPTYSKKNLKKYFIKFFNKRAPNFKTKTGRKYLKKLLAKEGYSLA